MLLVLTLLTAVPSIQDTIHPSQYMVAGPFLSGVRESSWRNLPQTAEDEDFIPKEGDSLFSVQTTGGWVYWEKIEVDSTGWLETSYANVEWEFLQDFYGFVGLYNSGYAYTEIEVSQPCRALAEAKKCGFSINDESYAGDVYGHGYVHVPVVLDSGVNRVWVRLGGVGDDRVYFRLIPVAPELRLIENDATLPDLVYGKEQEEPLYGAIPISNTTTRWIRNAQLVVGGDDFILKTFDLPPIVPGGFYKAPFEFKLANPLPDSVEDNQTSLPISLVWEQGESRTSLTLRCRRPDQSRKETFISAIDSSVQYYGLKPPTDYDASKDYPLLLGLHGAGVKAIGLVDAYTQKDWAFIATPTNRRRFGFDWQDWGRKDALEVLDKVKERYPIDENRIHLTGHSMGGHGTWHVGLMHPDLFASASPGAGWTNHQLYVPWTWQKSAIYAQPWQIGVRDFALRSDNQLAKVENALNLPFYILQGGADDNVPAFQARLYAKRLNQLGYEYHYQEVPEKGHWWKMDEGGACVNWPEMMGFMQNQVRDTYPSHVYYRTADLSSENSAYWLKIESMEDRMKDAVIQGTYDVGEYEIKTTNVARFALQVRKDLTGKRIKVRIDSDEIYLVPESNFVSFEKRASGWRKARSSDHPLPHSPIKGAYYQSFILVYGTRGDSAATHRLFRRARSQAQAWWMRANGRTWIIPDTAVTDEMIESYNLILQGNAGQNSVVARIEDELPIRIEDDRFYFGDEELPPEAVAALFIYPNPLNPERLVLVREGIGEDGLDESGYFSTLYSGAGLPDYVIWGEDTENKGWGGVIKAGFFPAGWKF